MLNFNFKKFLTEARSLPIDSQERHLLLSALNGIIKNDWSTLLIYSDWLQEQNDPLGEYIQLVVEQINNRRAGRKWEDDPDKHAKFRKFKYLDEMVSDRIIRRIPGWYYTGGHANDEWVRRSGNKKVVISVYNLRFRKEFGYADNKSISWNEVPTELLKAGLALFLDHNFHFDVKHHNSLRGVKINQPPRPTDSDHSEPDVPLQHSRQSWQQ